MMEKSVALVLVAGGSGSRMNSELPKQFLTLGDYPIFIHALKIFETTFPNRQIIIVCKKDYLAETKKLTQEFLPEINIDFTIGGATRFHSVKNGLSLVKSDIVMIHDAVRPFINVDFLRELYTACLNNSNAIPTIKINESVRQINGEKNAIINRDNLRMIQTPQCFQTIKLLEAFNQEYQEFFTDDASVLESYGETINLVNGLKGNFKITQPEDYSLAQLLIKTID